MRLISILFLLIFSTSLFAAPKAGNEVFNSNEKQAIEKMIHQYLLAHPEVLMEASRILQQREQNKIMQQGQTNVKKQAALLFDSKLMPIVGNNKGTVSLVEFLDYQCGYCRKASPMISKIIGEQKNLRVIFKPIAFFGEGSEYAAKAVIAAQKQDKLLQLHEALLKLNQPLNEQVILDAAKSVNIDTDKLKKDIQDDATMKAFEENNQLAEKMSLMGTPTFVVASYPANDKMKSYFMPGVPTYEILTQVIKTAGETK